VHPKTAKAIIADEEELNIGELAEAHLEDKKREVKKRPPSQARSQEAYHRIQHRKKDEFVWKQQLAKVWERLK
jgi:hypothetical protein